MVGADLSGIELRMLAHYLARFDDGRYARILLEDDIHQVNADKIGISRKQVKTVTYAFLYGAGDEKIGHSYDPQLSQSSAKKKGKEIRQAYVDAVDGLGDLLDAVKKAADRGFIKAIDGRKIEVDSPHKALNYLLQSSAGVIAKRWMVINDQKVKDLGLCSLSLMFVHDECYNSNATIPPMPKILMFCNSSWRVLQPQNANRRRSKIGDSWADTH